MIRTIALLALLSTAACASEPVQVAVGGAPAVGEPAAKAGTVDVRGLKTDLENGHVPLLVDVREPWEYSGGHVPSAINIPLGELETRLAELEPHKDQPVYVVCKSGSRSLAATQTLAKQGFQPINVEGGTSAWRSAGYAVD